MKHLVWEEVGGALGMEVGTFPERERVLLPLKSHLDRAIGEVGPNQRTPGLLKASGLSLDVSKCGLLEMCCENPRELLTRQVEIAQLVQN